MTKCRMFNCEDEVEKLGLCHGHWLWLNGMEEIPAMITCPQCGMTSYHPEDVRHKYCGNCHEFHEDMPKRLPAPTNSVEELITKLRSRIASNLKMAFDQIKVWLEVS